MSLKEQIDIDPYGEENWGSDKLRVETIVPKISEAKKDPFWYYDEGVVATVSFGDREIEIIPRGNIRVQFEEDGDIYRNQEAVEEATRRSYTDVDLQRLFDKGMFLNNNWFETFVDEGDESLGELEYDYDDAINAAIRMLRQ